LSKRTTCSTVDLTRGERWVYLDPATSPNESSVMNFQFTSVAIVLGILGLRKREDHDGYLVSRKTAAIGLAFGAGTLGLYVFLVVLATSR